MVSEAEQNNIIMAIYVCVLYLVQSGCDIIGVLVGHVWYGMAHFLSISAFAYLFNIEIVKIVFQMKKRKLLVKKNGWYVSYELQNFLFRYKIVEISSRTGKNMKNYR